MVSLKWLGNAGFIIISPGGKTIIIDPLIADNPLSPVKLGEIAIADIVLVTHNHDDHVGDAADIVKKTNATLISGPDTAGRLKSQMGVPAGKVIFGGYGMNIGESAELKGITITMTEAFHSSGTDCPAGYIVKLENDVIIYHAGDTGIFESMRFLAEQYTIDIALIPIGSLFPTDQYRMDPVKASNAVKLLKPKEVIPMHYSFEADASLLSRFVELANKEAPRVKIIVLEPGQEHIIK